ncbi:MAG: hypothetical protein ABTR54_14455, partial [Candidatus Competibacter sp.]
MAKDSGKSSKEELTVRTKILLGISTVLVILLVLGGTAIFNLGQIRAKFDGSVDATQVERHALSARSEVRNYRLHGDDQYVAKTMEHLDKIVAALDAIDKTSTDAGLLQKSKEARAATLDYRRLFESEVAAQKTNREAVHQMIQNGLLVVKLADEYYQSTKKETALWVYITALRIMKTEKEERLHKDREFYKEMLAQRAHLTRYYDELDPAGTDDKVNQARKATEDYFKAAAVWIENDTQIAKEIQPAMTASAEKVVGLASDAASDAAKSMIATQNLSNSIIKIGIGIAVVLGVLVAVVLANIICRPIGGEPAEMAVLTQQIAHGD